MVAKKRKCPERGQIGWLSMKPQTGREQGGRRPVVCLSPSQYNRKSGLAVFCPITSKTKGYPFEVAIKCAGIDGVVLADQVKSLDWKERDFELICTSSADELDAVVSRSVSLLQG